MDSTNRNSAQASALVEELCRCGVRHAVLSPGSRSTPLALALHREPRIDLTVIVDERSAAFFALGAAQATGTPVAILCTSGTAAANLHPAICEADESGVPLIALTADRPPELRGIGAGQTIDQIKLFGAAVRWFCEVGTHDADDDGLLHFRSIACRAFATARGEPRPGPVHLNIAWREPLAPIPEPGGVTATDKLALEGRGERPLTALATAGGAPGDFIFDEIAKHAGNAHRGLIVAGRQTDPGLREPLAALAHAAGFPILAEYRLVSPHVIGFEVAAYDRTRELVIDPSGAWNVPTNRAAAMVRADPAALASGLAERLSPAEDPAWADAWVAAEQTARAAIDAALAALDEPTEPGVAAALGAAYSDGDLIYTASSMPIRDQETFLGPSDADALFLANRGANGIDGLISSGIGAAHASGRPTVIVTGDLGLLHDIGSLAALRDVSAPVRIVVVNNDGGGIFGFLPQAATMDGGEFEELLGTPRGVDVGRAAALFGLQYRLVTDLGELQSAMSAGTGLIEVPVKRASNVALHRQLAQAVADALAPVR